MHFPRTEEVFEKIAGVQRSRRLLHAAFKALQRKGYSLKDPKIETSDLLGRELPTKLHSALERASGKMQRRVERYGKKKGLSHAVAHEKYPATRGVRPMLDAVEKATGTRPERFG